MVVQFIQNNNLYMFSCKKIYTIIIFIVCISSYSQNFNQQNFSSDSIQDVYEMTKDHREQYFGDAPKNKPGSGLQDLADDVYKENSQKITSSRYVPLSETHVKLNDGTYKAKYDVYVPGEDNEALNKNNGNDENFSIIVFILIIVFSYIVYLMVRKLDKKKIKFLSIDNTNNELTFSKQKYTDGLIYKSSPSTVSINDDFIEVNVFPNIIYSGKYRIKEKLVNKNYNIIRYLTTNSNGNEFIIDCENNNKIIKIFNNNKEGIILKR